MTAQELRRQNRIVGLMRLRRLRVTMTIWYSILVALAIAGITVFALTNHERSVKTQASTLMSSLNVQLKLNLDSYISRMESVGTLAFSVDNAYTYDATDPSNDEYESINTEKQISDQLYSLCMLENFVDYGIVYSNNHTVGKVSNGTTGLFGNELYNDLVANIQRERTGDGWFTGYQENYDRIYYVKRIHDNAVLVLSFYTTELESVFDNPETMNDMAIRLVDRNYNIIYSSEADELGNHLDSGIESKIADIGSAALMDSETLLTVNDSNVGWRIICSIPTDIILADSNRSRTYLIIAAAVAALIAMLIGGMFTFRLTNPIRLITENFSSEDFAEDEDTDAGFASETEEG